MTIPYSPYNNSLTLRFSQTVEYKLFPWFEEAFSAHAHLNYPFFGISKPMQNLFPGYVATTDDNDSANVFAATLDFSGPDDGVPKDVCLKFARGVDEVVRLSHEASVYRKELTKLWGIAVPRMYGFFMGHYEDTPVACLLLELCVSPNDGSLYDSEEFIRLAMQNVRKVHTAGITQNMPLELHHFVMKDNKVLLVDFSRAVVHRCNNAMPVYSNQRFCLNRAEVQDGDEHDCSEVMSIAKVNMRAASVEVQVQSWLVP
ncbi:hypothetical protein B0F90DRAFT_1665640 [Multifurca ochricompacta]|uniref:Protein kinase domain-containing protein n=1 Tax=Multifurca ochricompacta TaxID=376703 RepID=A0AAD4QRQ8_9AGAM|nr:hypothetical protein B0F90DRAFT_1665640 [Multifurca ochricompacta]